MNLFDWAAALISAGILAGYFLWLARKIAREPNQTVIGYSTIKRHAWVESIVEERRDILAVQTLRNWTTAASFMATTAILIATGALHFLVTIPQQPELLHQLNFLGSIGPAVLTTKLLLIVGALLAAFFNFAVAVRYYNHVSIEINVANADSDDAGIANVQQLMDRGAMHYTAGMRSFYMLVPLALWLFGPVWMLLGAGGLCIALYRMDRLG